VRFEELYAIAARRIGLAPTPAPLETPAGRALAGALLSNYAAGAIELSSACPRFTTDVPERPSAPAFARLMAADNSPTLTNLRHESYAPRPLERAVLQLLDGTNDRDAMRESLLQLADAGLLQFAGESTGPDRQARRRLIGQALDEALQRLARRAFILDPAATD
jgi:hypothetical protein